MARKTILIDPKLHQEIKQESDRSGVPIVKLLQKSWDKFKGTNDKQTKSRSNYLNRSSVSR